MHIIIMRFIRGGTYKEYSSSYESDTRAAPKLFCFLNVEYHQVGIRNVLPFFFSFFISERTGKILKYKKKGNLKSLNFGRSFRKKRCIYVAQVQRKDILKVNLFVLLCCGRKIL